MDIESRNTIKKIDESRYSRGVGDKKSWRTYQKMAYFLCFFFVSVNHWNKFKIEVKPPLQLLLLLYTFFDVCATPDTHLNQKFIINIAKTMQIDISQGCIEKNDVFLLLLLLLCVCVCVCVCVVVVVVVVVVLYSVTHLFTLLLML